MTLRTIFILVGFAFFSACSSAPPSNSAVTSPNTNAAVNDSAAQNPTLSNSVNGATNLNPNSFNSPTNVTTPKPYVAKQGELPYGQRTAPDDSVVSAESRGKDFVETRTFKNHPTLAKVEKITDGTTTKFKIYLKSGKVVDGPADKLQNFTAMAPYSILDSVGMAPTPAELTNRADMKKKENPQ